MPHLHLDFSSKCPGLPFSPKGTFIAQKLDKEVWIGEKYLLQLFFVIRKQTGRKMGNLGLFGENRAVLCFLTQARSALGPGGLCPQKCDEARCGCATSERRAFGSYIIATECVVGAQRLNVGRQLNGGSSKSEPRVMFECTSEHQENAWMCNAYAQAHSVQC